MVQRVCCDAKERVACCDTVVQMFNMVAVLHCIWDNWGATEYQAAGDSAEDYEAAMRINRLILQNCDLQCTTHVSLSVLQIAMCSYRQYTIVRAQKMRRKMCWIMWDLIMSSYQRRQPHQWVFSKREMFAFTPDWQHNLCSAARTSDEPTLQPSIEANIIQIPRSTSSRCQQELS